MQLHMQGANPSARLRLITGLALCAWLLFGGLVLAGAALAQEVVPLVTTEATFLQQLVLALVPLIGLVITTLIGIGVALLKQKTGIDIEAKHRDALQSALLNGVLFALQKAGWVAGQPITPSILSTARGYVESSVPDALTRFGIDAATDVGKATLDRLLTPKLPMAIGTVMPNGDKLIGRVP